MEPNNVTGSIRSNGATKSGSREGPTILLISAKPNEIIWVDFAKLANNKRTVVKVLIPITFADNSYFYIKFTLKDVRRALFY